MKTEAIVLAAMLIATPTFAAEFTCRVSSVLDGDTVACIGYDEKIRLTDIDAPEIAHPGKPGQPYGDEARRALDAMVGRKDVRVVWAKQDRYGRKLATIYAGDTDVNAEMIRGGHAWVYEQYSSGQREQNLLLLQEHARIDHAGLWAAPESQWVKPWDFRSGKSHANDNDDQSVSPTILGQPECGTKKTCSQMTSCSEATAFFTKCKGMGSLDGDGDGKPCNSLCR